MPDNEFSKILFIINPSSGTGKTDWKQEIVNFFKDKNASYEVLELTGKDDKPEIKKKLAEYNPHKVIAVGGDGTVKIVAEALLHTEMILGILPAGSANGMATELGIKDDAQEALGIIVNGKTQKIDVLKLNEKNLSIHLSDIGFNAYVVKKFEDGQSRGMWGYLKAAFRVIWQYQKMQVRIQTDKEEVSRMAAMVVIANGTKYGNGVVINPLGSIYDNMFEVIVIRKISFREILKMRFSQKGFDPAKTEFFQTHSLNIKSRHHVHFQVDGEVMKKTKSVKAEIKENALKIIVPKSNENE